MDAKRLKVCPQCVNHKPRDAFVDTSGLPNHLGKYCADCHAVRDLECRAEGLIHEASKTRRLRIIYGDDWQKWTYLSDFESTLASERDFCPYCGIVFASDHGNEVHFDHMDPLALGGEDSIRNLVMVCKDCNRMKGDRSFLDWLGSLPSANQQLARTIYTQKHRQPPESFTIGDTTPRNKKSWVDGDLSVDDEFFHRLYGHLTHKPSHPDKWNPWFDGDEWAQAPATAGIFRTLEELGAPVSVDLSYADAIDSMITILKNRPPKLSQVEQLRSYGEDPATYRTRADADRFLSREAEEEQAQRLGKENREIAAWRDNWAGEGLVLTEANIYIDDCREFDKWVRAMSKMGFALPLPASIDANQLRNVPGSLETYLYDMNEVMINLREGKEIRGRLKKAQLVAAFPYYLRELWSSPGASVDDEAFLRLRFPEICIR